MMPEHEVKNMERNAIKKEVNTLCEFFIALMILKKGLSFQEATEKGVSFPCLTRESICANPYVAKKQIIGSSPIMTISEVFQRPFLTKRLFLSQTIGLAFQQAEDASLENHAKKVKKPPDVPAYKETDKTCNNLPFRKSCKDSANC